jgi:mannosyltransferase
VRFRSTAISHGLVIKAVAVTGIVVLGFCLRWIQSREGLWLDELHTAWVASGPASAIVDRSIEGNQSPLFFWLESLLVRTFSAREVVLRMPSIIAGSLLPVVIFALVKTWTGKISPALIAALILAVDRQALYFGTEARPYALIQLGAVLHVWLFWSLAHRPTYRKHLAFILGAALLLHLHYTSALLLAAEIMWFLLTRNSTSRLLKVRALTIDFAAVGLLVVPALPIIAGVWERRENWRLFVDQRAPWLSLSMIPWAITALLAWAWVMTWRKMRGVSAANVRFVESPLALAIAWLTVPVIIAWVTTATDVARLLTPRYVVASAPAAAVLIGLALNEMPPIAIRRLIIATFAVAVLVMSPVPRVFMGREPVSWRQDGWREAVAWFNAQSADTTGTVLLRSLLIEADGLRAQPADSALIDYLRYPLTSLYRITGRPDRILPLTRSNPQLITETTLRTLQRDSSVWLVFQGDATNSALTKAAMLEGTDDGRGNRLSIAEEATFGNVHLVRFLR